MNALLQRLLFGFTFGGPTMDPEFNPGRREAMKSAGVFLVAPSLLRPLRFKTKPKPAGLVDRFLLKTKIFTDTEDEIMSYFSAIIGPDGSMFDGPSVTSVEIDDAGVKIRMQDLLIKESTQAHGIVLFHPNGEERGDYRFIGGLQAVNPGDTLKINVNLTVSDTGSPNW